MAKVIKKRSFGGSPPVDFTDLSYFMPLMTAGALKESSKFPFYYGAPLRSTASVMQNMGKLPRWLIYEKFVRTLMVTEDEVEGMDSEKFARWVTRQYEGRRFPYIVVGPTLGSLVYLSAVLDAPFLPMNFSIAVRHKKMNPDDSKEHLEIARKRAEAFLRKDKNIEIVHEYDPVHERFKLKHGTLLRFRMKTLPEAYKKFIKTYLNPTGSIVFIESRVGWRQYKVSERFFHQVGSPGGIPCDEYYAGSKRIELFLEKFMQEKVLYRLNYRDELLPESRFGVTPGNRMDIIAIADELKRNLCLIFTDDIYQLNKLVSRLFLVCARREGLRPRYCYVQSGVFLSPYWCLHSLVIPIWVPSPCYEALKFVQDFIQSYPFDLQEILLSFEPSIEEAPDFMMLSRWREALSGGEAKIRYIGMNPSRYPHDVTSYFKYWSALSKWAVRRKQSLDMRITVRNLIQEAEACDIKFQVTEHQ